MPLFGLLGRDTSLKPPFSIVSLFTGLLLEAAGLSDGSGDDLLINNAKLVMILASMGLPGYWLGIYLIDR